MPALEVLTALGIGVLSGVIAALCGVGGGVVMVPAFVMLMALPQKHAVATSLAIIIPTAIMATVQNAKSDFIHWKLVLITSISAATFAYFGAGWLKDLSNDTLTRVFGIILVVFGVKMLLQGKG